MGQIDWMENARQKYEDSSAWLSDRHLRYIWFCKAIEEVNKHLKPQQTNKKAEEWIEAENILYDYGFQAGRLYEKHHPSDKKAEVCKHRFINTNHLCTYCWEQVFTEPQQEMIVKSNICTDKDCVCQPQQEDKKIEPVQIEMPNDSDSITLKDKIEKLIMCVNYLLNNSN